MKTLEINEKSQKNQRNVFTKLLIYQLFHHGAYENRQ